jgi:hypothetical protein
MNAVHQTLVMISNRALNLLSTPLPTHSAVTTSPGTRHGSSGTHYRQESECIAYTLLASRKRYLSEYYCDEEKWMAGTVKAAGPRADSVVRIIVAQRRWELAGEPRSATGMSRVFLTR